MFCPETQLTVYSNSRALEARAAAIEQGIRRLKNCCLDGGELAIAQLVSIVSELKWQLRQAAEVANQVGANLGMKQSDAAAIERAEKLEPSPAPESMRESHEISSIRGSTEVLAVPDLVSTLSSLRKTGTLTLQAADAMFVFEFQEGKIVHAVTNSQEPGLRLGTILEAQSKITAEQLEENLAACRESNELLGAHLVRTATVSDTDLREALDTQVRRIFEAAFSLSNARFSFDEGSLSRIAQRAAVNTTELLLEAARQRDHAGRGRLFDSAARGSLDSVLSD
ncbi:MAG: DUF4388 domain-containing protein [Planctomycetes bacterium]|nr:DUF4388 domain-containing protein [Planctomycetota bacterium]